MSSDPRWTPRPRQWCQCIQEKALRVCDPLRAHLCIPCRGESHTNVYFQYFDAVHTFLALNLFLPLPSGSWSPQEIWRSDPGLWWRSLQSLFRKSSMNIWFWKHMLTDALHSIRGFRATLLDFTIWNNCLCFMSLWIFYFDMKRCDGTF